MNQDRPRRREYSKQFKAEVLTRCAQPGASVGGVALAQGLHSNMVHRWIREQRERQALAPPAFVPLRMP
ncbi:transposase, partial [Acidovorax sp. T1m]